MRYDAIVIGAGPNGLVAAAVLAGRGRRVVVLEAATAVGGHTRAIEFAPGYRAPLIEDDGALLRNVARALPSLSAPQVPRMTRRWGMGVVADGGLLALPSWSHGPEPALAAHSRRDAERWPVFLRRFARYARVLERLYQVNAPDIGSSSPRELLSIATLGLRVRALGRAGMTEFLRVLAMPVQDLVDDEFECEPLKAAVASAALRDLRQGPRSGGTVFTLLHQMVGGTGLRSRYWPVDGPDAFSVAATNLCRRLGVDVRTGARVHRILVRDGAATGVALDTGDEFSAPVVVSTADPRRTLLELVESQWLDPEFMHAVSNIKLRGATAYVLYATDAALPGTFIAPVSLTSTTIALDQAADAAKYGAVSAAPHVECYAPTLRWPSLAPPGKHIVVARVQYAPYALKSGAWTANDAARLRAAASAAIARAVPKFGDTVQHACVFTPPDIEREFGVTEGALSQGELMLDQILFMRPVPGWSRYAMPVRGLFLGGAGAHPGPGILGGAGYLAARAIGA